MSDTIQQEGVEIQDLGTYEDLQVQPVNSWDLTQTTFIIPLRIESVDRMRNITTTLIYLLRNFDTQIIIKEQDVESIFLKSVVPMLDQALSPEKMSKIHHIFEESEEEVFHRTRLLNDMLMLVETPVVCNYDCDVLLPMNNYILAQNAILYGWIPPNEPDATPEPVKCVYPYGYGDYQYQLRVNDEDCTRFINSNFNFNAFQQHATLYDAKFGFVQFFDTKEYLRLGGENEGFIAYGYEDDERYIRFNTCSQVLRLNDLVYHMEHRRTPNSWFNNPHIEENRSLWEELRNFGKTKFEEYYKNPPYMKYRGVLNGKRRGMND